MAKEVSAQSVLQATAGGAKYGRVDSPVSAASQLKFKPFALPARTAHATVSARTMAEEKTISLTCSAATVGQTTDQFEGNRLSSAPYGENNAKSHSSTLRSASLISSATAAAQCATIGVEGRANPSGEAHDSMKPDRVDASSIMSQK